MYTRIYGALRVLGGSGEQESANGGEVESREGEIRWQREAGQGERREGNCMPSLARAPLLRAVPCGRTGGDGTEQEEQHRGRVMEAGREGEKRRWR